ncbi:MAG: site-specific integrase [Chthoniobacterales bacterium]
MKKTWPKIKRVINHGTAVWMVDTRINGKGERKFFATKSEADGEAAEARIKRLNEGSAAVVNAELASYGWSVAKAIEFALEHLRKASKAKPLKDAVEDFTAAKADKSDAYKRDLKGILDAFKAAVPTATTASVTTDEINGFLAGLHPVTANNRRRVLAVFFSWCVKRKLRTDNPAEGAEVAKETPGTPGVLTPDELAAMLSAAEARILPSIVLGAFAGLRQAEIKRLDWRNVDLAEGVVTLDAGTTKTNSRRAVRLPAAAVAWLTDVAENHGPIFTTSPETRAAWDLARMAAGFGPFKTSLQAVRQATATLTPTERKALRPWPENALRHSAISYRLALRPEAAADAFKVAPTATDAVIGIGAVAYASGNSPKMIREHYDALCKPSAAAAWFSVSPEIPANVTPYVASA